MARYIEPVLIVAAILVTLALSAEQRWALELRWVFSYSAVVIFGQGLIRDLVTLARQRLKTPSPNAEHTDMRCLCAESTAGLALLVVGAGGLTLLGVHQKVTLGQLELTGLIAALLIAGYGMKDYVVSIRRVDAHDRIRVR